MSNINPTYRERVRFFIENPQIGRKYISEPLGWDDDNKEYARHERHGVFPKMSSSLKFVGSSAILLDTIWRIEGFKANIMLVKEEKHPHTNEWKRSYWGFLNMLSREVNEGILSFEFNSGGIEKTIKSRESQKIQLERLDAIDGAQLEPLKTNKLLLKGRHIFLETKYNILESRSEAWTSIESNAGNTRRQTVGFPLNLDSNSHGNLAHTVQEQSHGGELGGTTAMMFFAVNDSNRVLNIDFDITTDLFVRQYENIDWAKYWICLTIYENGTNYDVKERIPLYKFEDEHDFFGSDYDASSSYPEFTEPAHISYSNEEFVLLEGESLALEGYVQADFHTDVHARLRVRALNIQGYLHITEESTKEQSETKIIMAYEKAQRFIDIISNKTATFYSEALGRTDLGYATDGVSSLKGYAHGMWIRNFDALPENEENRYKPYTTSFKDFLEDLDVTELLGYGIERIGYSERLIIEPKDYFYQEVIAHRLPYQVQKVKRIVDEKNVYTGVEIGYVSGYENEEVQGLDDFHARSSWTTFLDVTTNIYTKISKYIYSSYAAELIRRKQIIEYPTDDHTNDKNIFSFDIKRYTSILFKEKYWDDVLDVLPTGVFSPETATKLVYSPLNIMLKHAKYFATALTKHPYQWVKLGSAEGATTLTTKLIGKESHRENDSIQNHKIQRPVMLPEIIEFEHIVDFETNQKLQGYTEINGRKVPNLFLLWEFENEHGETERGFIENVKLNGSGKWTLKKANR